MSVVCCPLSSGENYADHASVSKIRARKAHHCVECREAIAIKDEYERYVLIGDGSASTYKTCLSCVEIRDHFACDGWLFGQVWSDIENNFFPDMKAGGPCMEGLSPPAKARLFERRLAWLEVQDS